MGLHDFYSIHVLNICEGYYRSTNASSRVGSGDTEPKNVTGCSKDTFTSGLDLRETMGRELGNVPDRNIDSAKLRWPTGVDAGMRALNAVSRVMSVVYCVGLASIGVALLLSTLSIFFSGRLSACVNILVSSVAVLAVSIASILATAIGDKAAVLINEGGKQIGISAQKSTKFLSLTWIAPACMLAASFVWCLDCICGRRRGVSF